MTRKSVVSHKGDYSMASQKEIKSAILDLVKARIDVESYGMG